MKTSFLLFSLFFLGFIVPKALWAQTAEGKISYELVKKVVPFSGDWPAELKPQKANNNVDLTLFAGRYYLAYRTAPSHFASRKTEMHLVSSLDFETFRYEYKIALGSDVREPRFLELDGKLLLYFVQLGKSMFSFAPQHLYVAHFDSAARQWTRRMVPQMDGFVPWRLRKDPQGRALLSAYDGVDLYKPKHKGNLRLFTTTDGFSFQPLTEQPQCSLHGAEEGEFIFDAQGALWATIRLEGGGGAVAKAEADNIGQWHLKTLKKKYDSALLFRHGEDIYLVARRNADKKGGEDADKAPKWMGPKLKHKYNLLRYSLTPKRTALYYLNRETQELEWLWDLPSMGDTAFAGIAPHSQDPNAYWLVNYSNDFTLKKDYYWLKGQRRPTNLYLFKLKVKSAH